MTAPHKKNIVYVTRDIERALGIKPNPHYRIVSYRTPFAEKIQAEYPDFVTLIDAPEEGRDTLKLLKEKQTQILISETDSAVVVFKNNSQIESFAKEHGMELLNPKAALAEKVENKISQIEWLGDLAKKYLPKHVVRLGKDLIWGNMPYVVQWGHGHTGDGTLLVSSESDVQKIKKAFPERTARVTALVRGPSFTVNAIVTHDKTLMGTPNYQITGLPPFTDHEFTTVGNDWSVAHDLLSEKELATVELLVGEIGHRLLKDGWRGLFGVDFIRDEELNKLFLIEINARQPAGAVFESYLQEENRRQGIPGLTVFEAHIQSLTGEMITQPLVPINDGAQIVQRITKLTKNVPTDATEVLEAAGYHTIKYPNTAHNADLLRIQSTKGIIEMHGKLNKRGKEILKILTP